MKLFDDDWGGGSQELDDTQITTTYLYFSEKEKKEFNKLAKKGIEKMFNENRFEKGNYSDLILNLLRQYNEEN